jgi:hypothetical protein
MPQPHIFACSIRAIMRPVFSLLLFIVSFLSAGAQSFDDKDIIISNVAYQLRKTHMAPEAYVLFGTNEKQLLNIQPYFGGGAEKGLLISFEGNDYDAFVADKTPAKAMKRLIKELEEYKMLNGDTVNTKMVGLFVEKHKLPEGYVPPEESNGY